MYNSNPTIKQDDVASALNKEVDARYNKNSSQVHNIYNAIETMKKLASIVEECEKKKLLADVRAIVPLFS